MGAHIALLALPKPCTVSSIGDPTSPTRPGVVLVFARRTKLQLQRRTLPRGSSLPLRSQSDMEDGPSSTSCFRRLTDCFLGSSTYV